jgi:nucleoid DNA-binding protein
MKPYQNLISKDKLKEVLLNKTATLTVQPTSTVEKVIGFVFEDAKKAFRIHKEVEISGFGVYKMSNVKVIKGLAKFEHLVKGYRALLENPSLTPEKRAILESKLESSEKAITYLKTKVDED